MCLPGPQHHYSQERGRQVARSAELGCSRPGRASLLAADVAARIRAAAWGSHQPEDGGVGTPCSTTAAMGGRRATGTPASPRGDVMPAPRRVATQDDEAKVRAYRGLGRQNRSVDAPPIATSSVPWSRRRGSSNILR
jgi:hypothetical protein